VARAPATPAGAAGPARAIAFGGHAKLLICLAFPVGGTRFEPVPRGRPCREQLLIPRIAGEAGRVEQALEERTREDAVRLKRFRARRR
jgi:hypothetical protein